MTYSKFYRTKMNSIYTNTLSKFFSKKNLTTYDAFSQMFLFVLIHEFASGIILYTDHKVLQDLNYMGNVFQYHDRFLFIFNGRFTIYTYLLDMTNTLLEEKRLLEKKRLLKEKEKRK